MKTSLSVSMCEHYSNMRAHILVYTSILMHMGLAHLRFAALQLRCLVLVYLELL